MRLRVLALVLVFDLPLPVIAAQQFCDPILDVATRGLESLNASTPIDPFGTYKGEYIFSSPNPPYPEARTYRSTFLMPGAKYCTVGTDWGARGRRTSRGDVISSHSQLDCMWSFQSLTEAKREAAHLEEQISQCFPSATWNGLLVLKSDNHIMLSREPGGEVGFSVDSREDDGRFVCFRYYDEEAGCEFHPNPDVSDSPPVFYMSLMVFVTE